jgi:hypothetical protein
MIADLFRIICGECGHEAPIDDFAERPLSGTLPIGSYQCPACNWAWSLRLRPDASGRRSEVVIVPEDPNL